MPKKRKTVKKNTRDIALHTTSVDQIEQAIHTIRGHRVMLDAELAELYGVQTRVLNQAIKRHAGRFPGDFVFRLTTQEKAEVITNCDHLARLRFSPNLPLAFTEHGALMAANLLNSDRAVEVSVEVVRAFIRLRQMAGTVKELARKINEMEKKYDESFRVVFEAIRQLTAPPEDKPKGRMGFHRTR